VIDDASSLSIVRLVSEYANQVFARPTLSVGVTPHVSRRRRCAFALKELLAIIVIGAALLTVAVIELENARGRSRTICCSCNLKQIGLSFRTWELDHTGLYPMAVSTNRGGSMEYIESGEVFRHFEALSNELSTPIVLTCPSDDRKPAKGFDSSLSNSNISYFVGLDASSQSPQMFLTGDRNITGGKRQSAGIVELTTNDAVSWGPTLHKISGNIGLADGSVQQFTKTRLQQALMCTGAQTNRLALP
jgi:hypothetical protein